MNGCCERFTDAMRLRAAHANGSGSLHARGHERLRAHAELRNGSARGHDRGYGHGHEQCTISCPMDHS